jgi:HAMP domain-containing protein
MTFRKKLKIGTGVPLVIFLMFAVVFYLQTWWVERCIKRVAEVGAPRSEATSRMEIDLVGMGFELLGYLQDHDPVRIEQIQNYKKDFREYQGIYCRLVEAPEAELSVLSVDKGVALLGKITEELINLENHQVQRLTLLRENFEEMDEILGEGFRVHSESEEQNGYKKLGTVMEMKGKTDEIRRNLSSYLADYQERYENRIFEAQKELGILANVYKDLHAVSEHKQWFERFDNIYAENLSLIKEIVALDGSKRVRLDEFVKVREDLHSALGNNIEKAHANLEDARQRSYRAVGVSAVVTLVLVFVGLVAALISQAYIADSVTLPITDLRDAAAKISQGQYDTRIEIRSDDELGQLAESIGKMTEDLKRLKALSGAFSGEAAEREETRVST